MPHVQISHSFLAYTGQRFRSGMLSERHSYYWNPVLVLGAISAVLYEAQTCISMCKSKNLSDNISQLIGVSQIFCILMGSLSGTNSADRKAKPASARGKARLRCQLDVAGCRVSLWSKVSSSHKIGLELRTGAASLSVREAEPVFFGFPSARLLNGTLKDISLLVLCPGGSTVLFGWHCTSLMQYLR